MLQFHYNYETFATSLRAIRKSAHMTQKDLANETGIPRTRICEWERALRLPSYESFKKLMNVFHQHPEAENLSQCYQNASKKTA